jgi:hypothetical protein
VCIIVLRVSYLASTYNKEVIKLALIRCDLKFDEPLTPLELDKMKFIVVHHIKAIKATPEEIHKWHLENGWAGAGYNEYITKQGNTYIMRGDHVGAHCEGYNHCSYGIAVEGNYETESMMPPVQYEALVERIRFNLRRFPKNCTVIPHRELGRTSCPGKYFPIAKLLSDVSHDPNTIDVEFVDNLKYLQSYGKIKSPEYWIAHCVAGGQCNGLFVKILLNEFANVLKNIQP